MIDFYIDESGYTGGDLLNKEQPFVGVSSVLICEGTAKQLVNDFFPKIQADELKHKNLSRRENYWNNLLAIQDALLNEHFGITYVCNKKYLLCLLFLSTCLEPFYYQDGKDFFKNGEIVSIASLMYKAAPAFWGRDEFDDLLYLFQNAMKVKSDVSINALTEKAKYLSGRKLSELLIPLSNGHHGCIEEIKFSKSTTDPVVITMISLISHIEKYIKEKYRIIHDRSRSLTRYHDILNVFIGIEDNVSFPQSDITSFNFPLMITEVTQEDSKNKFGLQMADLLVGGAIEHAMSQMGLIKKNDYNQKIASLYRTENFIHLLPSTDFEGNVTRFKDTDSFDFIEFITRKMQ